MKKPIILPLLTLTSLLQGDPTEALQLLQNGDYPQAIEQYQNLPQEQQNPQTAYNHGIALYRSGDLQNAQEKFTQTLQSPKILHHALAYHNRGNTRHQIGLQTLNQNPQETLKIWKQAQDDFQNAIEINTDLEDAYDNLETITKKIKALEKLLEEQQKQQEQDPQNQEQQQQQQDQNNQDQPDQNQDPSQQNQEPQNQPEQNQPQEPQSQENQNPSSSDPESDDSSEPDPQNSSSEQEQPENGDSQNPPQKQDTSSSEREEKEDSSRKDPNQQAQSPREPQAPKEDSPSPAEGGSQPLNLEYMSAEEAQKILQSLEQSERKLPIIRYDNQSRKKLLDPKRKNWWSFTSLFLIRSSFFLASHLEKSWLSPATLSNGNDYNSLSKIVSICCNP